MTRSLLPILVALLWLNSAVGQVKPSKPPLELTVEVVAQNYCAASSSAAELQMNLRLRYTNVGNERLILYKGHDLFYQTKIRSKPGGEYKPYEVVFLNARYFDEEHESIDQSAPSKVFVVLSPGGAFTREMTVGIGVVNDEASRGNFAVPPGSHTLQLIVSTWYKSRPLAQRLRQQWQRKGLLWFDPLSSAPLNVLAQAPEPLRPCKPSNKISQHRDIR